jgi:hemolysin activation/secretion protein
VQIIQNRKSILRHSRARRTIVGKLGYLLFATIFSISPVTHATRMTNNQSIAGFDEFEEKTLVTGMVLSSSYIEWQNQQDQQKFILPLLEKSKLTGAPVTLREFKFEGNTVFSNETLRALLAPYIGKTLNASLVEEIRILVTRQYLDAGYINSGALLVLPANTVGATESSGALDGSLRFRIIEGRVHNLQLAGEGRLRPDYFRHRLLRDDEVFNMKVLQERFQLLLLDPLFQKINSRIVPGDALGSATLELDVTRATPYGLNVFANNHRSPSIGAQVFGVSGHVRNLTTYGDVLEAQLSHSAGGAPSHFSWSVPLAASSTSMQFNFDKGRTSVIEEPIKSIDIKSQTKSIEVQLNQNMIHSLQRKIDIGFSIGQRKTETTLLGEAFSFTPGEPDGVSKLSNLKFSQDWVERWDKQALALRSVLTFGRNNIDPTQASVPTADQSYVVWTGQLQWVYRVADDGSQVLIKSSVQKTPHRLLPMERSSIGGANSVRGYRENALVRDQSVTATAEYQQSLWQGKEDKNNLMGIVFADVGRSWNQQEKHQTVSSIGLGLSWRFAKLSTDLFLAKRLTTLPNQTHGNLQDRGVHFQINYSAF